ncbi:MAG: hypothetical protein IKF38_04815 [Clostridia bacterium]|nr:hypothetical protein [Clostridia bacterium]
MPTKKKTSKTSKSKEKKIEKDIERIEKNIEEIEKAKEFEESISKKKEEIREDLKSQLIAQNKFGKQFDDMVEDYIYFVELKERLQHDLDINGIRYKATGGNGFTTFKPNESYERLLKTNGQMLTILEKMDLKAPDEGPKEGEGDDLL